MNRIATLHAVTAFALALGAPALRAQNTLDTTLAARAGTRLSVSNMSGEVVVRAWDRAQVRVVAEYDRARVEVDDAGGRISIRTVARHSDADVSYTVTVPNGTAVEVNGVSSDVTLAGVCGETNVNSVSGDVDVQCVTGDATIASVSGNVTVSDARGGVDAGSTSGDVSVRGARGAVTAHSVSGSVSLSQLEGTDVSAQTVSGDIDYTGRILDTGRYRFEAHSGDVELRVAGTLNAAVSVQTFSGDLESDFPIQLTPGTRMGRQEMEFRLGNGSARLRLSSFSGTIELRRTTGGSPREE
jgi:DUF4097 and DUF4098 domain-containing protein YvlB